MKPCNNQLMICRCRTYYKEIDVIFNYYLKILLNPKDVFSGSGLVDFFSVSRIVDDFSVELEFVFESEDSMFL